jgi:hypothetical protein
MNHLSDLERYVRGEMSKREENSFLRKLQKDPFTEDTAGDSTENSLHEKAEERGNRNLRRWDLIDPDKKRDYIRVAASVIIFLAIGTALIFLLRNRTTSQFIVSLFQPRNINTHETTQVTYLTEDSLLLNNQSAEETSENNITETNAGFFEEPDDNLTRGSLPGATETQDQYSEGSAGVVAPDNPAETRDLISGDSATIQQKTESEFNQGNAAGDLTEKSVTGENLTGENLPGESMTGGEDIGEALPPVSYPARPTNGQENFVSYIKENIRRPSSTDLMDNAVVVISFKVRSTGLVDSLTVLSTPGDEFSEEAMRLIREGPSWLPAVTDGQYKDEEISLRIVFK